MAHDDMITGIDIGSSMIRVATGQLKPTPHGGNTIHIIGAAEHPADGISKGAVTSIEDAVASISAALEKCERMTGVPVERATVSVNGSHVLTHQGHGIVAISKANGEVAADDIDRVIESAQQVVTPANYEILHVVPQSYTIDDQHHIKDPLGMTGIKLEVDAQIVLGLTPQIKNVTKAVYRAGVTIDSLVVEALASAEAVVTKRQKDLGVVVLNIGMATTSMIVFEEGEVLDITVLPIGSGHITNDIAIGLRIAVDTAETVKLEYGTALRDQISDRDEIDLASIDDREHEKVPTSYVGEIVQARVEELFHVAQKRLKAIDRDGQLPAGVILTGGGAKLDGLVEYAKNSFRMAASLGAPAEIQTPIEKIYDPTFSTAIGLILWSSRDQSEKQSDGSRFNLRGQIPQLENIKDKVVNWVKSLMP